MDQLPRIDVWFELHGDLNWPGQGQWIEPYLSWMHKASFELCVNSEIVDLFRRKVHIFPASLYVERHGPYWFTSSIAWMMAYAIDEGATEIGLYGCDMAVKDEYYEQRPGVRRWVEIAEEKGIKVIIPPESDLTQPPQLYGYSYTSPMGRKLMVRQTEIRERINRAQAKRAQLLRDLDNEISHLNGALDQLDYTLTIWANQTHIENSPHQLPKMGG
jgi:hypothetical protein